MGIWFSSSHCSTPTCARPSAPPPSSATPIFRRGFAAIGAADTVGACGSCAAAKKGSRSNVTTAKARDIAGLLEKRERTTRSLEFVAAEKFEQGKREGRVRNSGRRFIFLNDIPTIDYERLAGNVRSIG